MSAATKAKVLPGSDVDVPRNVTSSEFVYYRVYHNHNAIATKRPAYWNDIYIGRIRSKWVTPPHTAGSLRLCVSSMESIDPDKTQLFATGSNQSVLADEAPISLKSNQTLGIIPEDPVILFSKAMPQTGMERGTESFRVPLGRSPLASRFLFYGVYSEAGVRASKAPIDAEQPWVSKIDLNSILSPVVVSRVLHILNMKEGINTSPQLLAQDGKNLGDDQIFSKDGKSWLGASAEDHLVLKFGRPPFAEGSAYMIRNCCTGNSLGFQPAKNRYDSGHVLIFEYYDGIREHFTLRLQYDGSVACCHVDSRCWIPLSCTTFTSEKEHGFWLIPSTTNKNYFFICEGDLFSPTAFYDPGATGGASNQYYHKGLRDLDTTDTRQMWSLIPAVN